MQRIDPFLPRYTIRCPECSLSRELRGPLSRVHFVLTSMTACPCGGLHLTLPNALAFGVSLDSTESSGKEKTHAGT